MRLGILTSHPIQYQAPWFRALAKDADLEVFFAHRQSAAEQGKAGFGLAFEWDVDLLSGYKHNFLNNVVVSPGVNRFFGCDTPEIKQIIRDKKFDAFIVTGWHLKSYWQAVWACRREGVPIMVRGDSQLHTPRSLLRRWGKEVSHRVALKQFDGFLSVGKRNRDYLVHYGIPAEKIFSTPHFVDNEWFAVRANKSRARRAEQRAAWGIGEADIAVLFVGKFTAKKRPGDLLHALARLRQKGIKAKGVVVGAGELETRLRDEAKRLGVVAEFVGFKNQTELPQCYASADVLVLPSEGGETWGLVVNEAMACGLPAIVSDAVGCAPDLIEDGETGFIFPLGNDAALAERLAAFAQMKLGGHDFAPALIIKMRTYSLETAVAETLRAAEKLVELRR